MPQNTSTANRPHVPTHAEIEQRRAELRRLANRPQPKPRSQPGEPPPPPKIDPISAKPSPHATPRPQCPQPVLAEAALHGLAGLVVGTIAPHTEAHPAAILLQFLAAFGNLVGPGPRCMVDATCHGLNLFVVLVGESSKARKGTSWNQIARLFAQVDAPWLSSRVTTARLTAAGLVYALRDQQPPADRRLLALSEEFASVLHMLKRGGGNLSPLLRCAWDHGNLPALDTHQQLTATGAHTSLIAHITQRELAHNLPRTEAHNGFANRCLWAWVERSKCLPDGGNLSQEDLSILAGELRGAIDWATVTPQILFHRDASAGKLWQHRYPILSQLRPGMRGAATSRAEAQVLRLSAIYAALDSTPVIALPHLQAALAVWDYCYDSAALLFGMSTGDPVADRIREAIESCPDGYMTKYQIRRLFHGHLEASRIDAALEKLVALGALGVNSQPTAGRSSTLWSASQEKQLMEIEESPADDEPAEEE
jgi:hypothetical protein